MILKLKQILVTLTLGTIPKVEVIVIFLHSIHHLFPTSPFDCTHSSLFAEPHNSVGSVQDLRTGGRLANILSGD